MSVYFIRNTKTQEIKIGWSDEPPQRKKGLQTGSGGVLVVEAVLEGVPREMEGQLQKRFEHELTEARNEWFEGPDIEKYLEQIKRGAHFERRTKIEAGLREAVRMFEARPILSAHASWVLDKLLALLWRKQDDGSDWPENKPNPLFAVLENPRLRLSLVASLMDLAEASWDRLPPPRNIFHAGVGFGVNGEMCEHCEGAGCPSNCMPGRCACGTGSEDISDLAQGVPLAGNVLEDERLAERKKTLELYASEMERREKEKNLPQFLKDWRDQKFRSGLLRIKQMFGGGEGSSD